MRIDIMEKFTYTWRIKGNVLLNQNRAVIYVYTSPSVSIISGL